ncbi:hypothetical protein FORMB_07390 [Formosa sp. Hel1_33_131]|nr:hypothetical protein FORMB_07390 [Formosa sp. Hel1_33_131]
MAETWGHVGHNSGPKSNTTVKRGIYREEEILITFGGTSTP